MLSRFKRMVGAAGCPSDPRNWELGDRGSNIEGVRERCAGRMSAPGRLSVPQGCRHSSSTMAFRGSLRAVKSASPGPMQPSFANPPLQAYSHVYPWLMLEVLRKRLDSAVPPSFRLRLLPFHTAGLGFPDGSR